MDRYATGFDLSPGPMAKGRLHRPPPLRGGGLGGGVVFTPSQELYREGLEPDRIIQWLLPNKKTSLTNQTGTLSHVYQLSKNSL